MVVDMRQVRWDPSDLAVCPIDLPYANGNPAISSAAFIYSLASCADGYPEVDGFTTFTIHNFYRFTCHRPRFNSIRFFSVGCTQESCFQFKLDVMEENNPAMTENPFNRGTGGRHTRTQVGQLS